MPRSRAKRTARCAERAAARVRELCALGPRMGGTRSGARAAAYLREAFEGLGRALEVLEPSRATGAREAFVAAFRGVAWTAAALSGASALLVTRLPRTRT